MPLSLKNENLPSLFLVADKTSRDGQSATLMKSRAKVGLLVIAATMGAMSWHIVVKQQQYDVAGFIAALSFILAIFIEAKTAGGKGEQNWYEGRAAAESVKTQAWRYAVCGKSYPISMPLDDAVKAITDRLTKILQDINNIEMSSDGCSGDIITDEMRKIRLLPLEERKAIYIKGRIEEQRKWYAERASYNEAQMKKWSYFVIFLEIAAIIGALLKAVSVVDFDFIGIFTTLIAGIVSWAQVKQFSVIKNAYTIAAQDLSLVHSKAGGAVTEEKWSTFVEEAEEAISREHTVWRARETTNNKTRTIRSPSEM